MATQSERALPAAADGRLRQLLHDHGLRATFPRLAVLDVLEHAESDRGSRRVHLSAAEVHDRLARRLVSADLVTVYRTLTALVDIGVVHTVAHEGGQTTYGLVGAAHHHVVCTRCGQVVEIAAERLSATIAAIATSTGFDPANLSLTVRGTCAQCGRSPGRGPRQEPRENVT